MIFKGKILLWAGLLIGFIGCSDDSEDINQEITQADIENISSLDASTTAFTDAITISNDVLTDMDILNGRTQACYGTEETQNENEVQVVFQDECVGEDGRQRSGSIFINWSGDLISQNLSYTVTFDGYKVDGYGLDGSITTSDLTLTQSGFGFSVVVNDGVLTYPDGVQVNYEQDLNYDYTLDEVTELTIDGSITGTNRNGDSYIATIQNPLLLLSNCDYAVSGSFSATFNGRPALTVDYGDGTCDNKATLSRGNESITIELED